MKKMFTLFSVFFLIISSMYPQNDNLAAYLNNLPVESLDQTEIEGILLMREEEKLARDVYLTLYEKWSSKIFTNIASSEQTHMDWVGVLIEKYNLDDPMKEERGVFTDNHLKELYDALAGTGNESVEQAFFVGCTIEDLDIFDLEKLISKTDNIDVKTVYRNLMLGSRNHMRSFCRQYENRGLYYNEQYITKEELADILENDMETGPVDHNGEPLDLNYAEDYLINDLPGTYEGVNYPNPFSLETKISFNITASSNISAIIYDSQGRFVRQLVSNDYFESGINSITWNGLGNAGERLAGGLYTYHIYTEREVIIGRVILLE